MPAEKPLFIHVIGLEGCGHHGVFPIFEKVLTDKFAGTKKKLYFNAGLRDFLRAIYYKGLPRSTVLPDMKIFLDKDADAIFVDDDSYPSYVYRAPHNQWDFVEIHSILEESCDIRYFHLRRNIFDTINSHREWDGGLLGHARVLADIQRFIDAGLAKLSSSGVRVIELDYDNIGAEAPAIAQTTGCSTQAVQEAIQGLFKKSTKHYRDHLSDSEIETIGTLFGVKG